MPRQLELAEEQPGRVRAVIFEMGIQEQLSLSYYKQIGVLNSEHDVFLVQHVQTNAVYVMKKLSVYNVDVYRKLMAFPVRNIPRITEAIEEDGFLTVIEEYISGSTLRRILEERISEGQTKGLDIREALDYALQLCTIIKDLHSFDPPIIHRDIKPSNIIITTDNVLKLVDMDAAKIGSCGEARDTVLMGTEGYAAPEQYGFGSSGIRTDIYAIGVVMAEMAHGKFSRSELRDTLWDNIVEKCTRLSADERYSSVDEILSALHEIQHRVSRARYEDINSAGSQKTIVEISGIQSPGIQGNWLPPGFRTKKKGRMVLASLGYLLLIAMGFQIEVENATQAQVNLNRVFFILIAFMEVLIIGNYRGIWSVFGINRIRNRWIKGIAVAFIAGLALVLGILILVCLEIVFFR